MNRAKKISEKSKKKLTTYDDYVNNLSPERLREFEQGLQKELLSELIHARMKKDNILKYLKVLTLIEK